MSKIELVRQQEPCGCGVACVAMISDKTYDEVASLLGEWWSGRSSGMTHYVIFELLSHYGFALRNTFRANHEKYRSNEPWPPEPKAYAYIASISRASGGHFVVWTGEEVLDPMKDEPCTLDEYGGVNQLIAVYEID